MIRLILACLCLTAPLSAATRSLVLRAKPDLVFQRDPTKVSFTVQIIDPAATPVDSIKLLRLEAAGNESQVCDLHDDGRQGDEKENDGIHSCRVVLKEQSAGLIGFTAQADFPDALQAVRSRPLFVQVVTGTAKEKKGVFRILEKATQLYHETIEKRGLIRAKKETLNWLLKQPGIVGAGPAPKDALFVQFDSGLQMLVPAPAEKIQPQ